MSEGIHIDGQTALVLEGGGMRGVFTCGVLDAFMDLGISFPYAVGVSAGACNGLSYMSGQRGRARCSNIDLMDKYRYIGIKYLLTQRNIMDFHLLFHDFPERILPYDYEAYARQSARYEMVTTDCLTGKACYLEEKHDPARIISIVKASSSLPFVCPMVTVDGTPMLDGGIADSIPLHRAFSQGYTHAVVVLTREMGYRKPLSRYTLPGLMYFRYPKLRQAIAQRNELYNRQLCEVEQLEREGRILVIRPASPPRVRRMERDVSRLQALYDEGYRMAHSLPLYNK